MLVKGDALVSPYMTFSVTKTMNWVPTLSPYIEAFLASSVVNPVNSAIKRIFVFFNISVFLHISQIALLRQI